VAAVLQGNPPPPGANTWLEFRGSPPPMRWDPLARDSTQLDEILALVILHFEKQIEDVERAIEESLKKQDQLRLAMTRLDAGFSPAYDVSYVGTMVWYNWPLKDDPNSWPPTVSESPTDCVQNTKRKWQAESLRNWCQHRLSVEETHLCDLKKSLRALKTRAKDTYRWADVHTETVKTITVSLV